MEVFKSETLECSPSAQNECRGCSLDEPAYYLRLCYDLIWTRNLYESFDTTEFFAIIHTLTHLGSPMNKDLSIWSLMNLLHPDSCHQIYLYFGVKKSHSV